MTFPLQGRARRDHAQRPLTTPNRDKIVADVDSRIDALPESWLRVWERIKSAAD